GKAGTSGGVGHLVEYRGEAVRDLSMEGRMTLCNMSIEWGAKAGMVAPDDTTFNYLERRPHAPKGPAWETALDYWRSLPTEPGHEGRRRTVSRWCSRPPASSGAARAARCASA